MARLMAKCVLPTPGGPSKTTFSWRARNLSSCRLNDYDLFLVNEDGDVIANSTDTQDGTQDPIESILPPFFDFSGLSVVVVKASGSDRYLRVHAFNGRLAIQTAGNLYGHSAAENAVSVAMVDRKPQCAANRKNSAFNASPSPPRRSSETPPSTSGRTATPPVRPRSARTHPPARSTEPPSSAVGKTAATAGASSPALPAARDAGPSPHFSPRPREGV